MSSYNIISQNTKSTLVAEFTPRERRNHNYESEAQLEASFIKELQSLGYEYLNIHNERELILNLRHQLERLNNYVFSDKEWEEFFSLNIANKNLTVRHKARIIQHDCVQILKTEGNSFKNIKLLDKECPQNNFLQVINQYESPNGRRPTRYDVTILINGLPLIHTELKRRGVDIKEAFNQINRYSRESFWADSGLFEYIQLFVISNGTLTKYYSNTTREQHVKKQNESQGRKNGNNTSASFEFTSYWTDEKNNKITDLLDFTDTFFAKHTLLNLITRYCVFTSEEKLLVMRPYQIAATEKILQRIVISSEYKQYGTIQAGGYVWHTTGSGKTLTSFKTSQLASLIPDLDKVLFVVDRKDLDFQTIKEYERFQKGSVSDSKNTKDLQEKLEDNDKKIIVTTIQKLYNFISRNPKHKIYSQHVVIIFDECHRSQFSLMHRSITKHFRKYHLFGFTGTPIFGKNISASSMADMKTTRQVFGDCLHTYTIVNAINDTNVLPFRIDYIKTMKEKEGIIDKKVTGINTEEAFESEENIRNVVSYILNHFDQKTKRNSSYTLKDKRVLGFNSMMCVSSINVLIKYYKEFQRQMKDLPADKKLKIATIFSYNTNEDTDKTEETIAEENSDDTSLLDKSSRDFLDSAIKDYNQIFGTSYNTSSLQFSNYYKDVSMRAKNKEIDLLLVVNMFLTGFDAPCLNTLWVDKNLRLHGLMQAFSRTNRTLNSVKTFGNIVCFRNLEEQTNESIALFSDEKAGGIVLLKKFEDYYNGYSDDKGFHKGYLQLTEELQERFPLNKEINGEEQQKEFINLYSAILKARNILLCFDDFEGKEILSQRDLQDYQSIYIDLYHKLKKVNSQEKESILDDLVFEIELIKQVEVNIDYILDLIQKYNNTQDKEILISITKAIDSSVSLRNKKELIENFISGLKATDYDTDAKWNDYVKEQNKIQLQQIIEQEHLKEKETKELMTMYFKDGLFREEGTGISEILPPISRFGEGNDRKAKKNIVIDKLKTYFERFKDLISYV